MSYATVLSVHLGESVHEFLDLRHAHGFWSVVWNAISRTYYGGDFYRVVDPSDESGFWDLCYDKRIPEADRAVFRMTFDTHYVMERDFKRASSDIREFLTRHSWKGPNHWPRIAEVFDDPPLIMCTAIGFIASSCIGENPWVWDANQATAPGS